MADKNTILALIETNLPDNNAQEITPAKHRAVEQQITNASLNLDELTTQVIKGPVTFEQPPEGTPAVRTSFIVATNDTIAISDDPNATSFFTGLLRLDDGNGFTIDNTTGSVINNTGKTITQMNGTISTQPAKTGGTTTDLHLFSEKSSDGITWTKNANSGRSYAIANAGQSFRTTVSFIGNWADGEYLRFKFFASDSTLSFESSSFVADGDTVGSYSAVWNLLEY